MKINFGKVSTVIPGNISKDSLWIVYHRAKNAEKVVELNFSTLRSFRSRKYKSCYINGIDGRVYEFFNIDIMPKLPHIMHKEVILGNMTIGEESRHTIIGYYEPDGTKVVFTDLRTYYQVDDFIKESVK